MSYPSFSSEERWQVIERAMELDDLSDDELQLIDERIAAQEGALNSSRGFGAVLRH